MTDDVKAAIAPADEQDRRADKLRVSGGYAVKTAVMVVVLKTVYELRSSSAETITALRLVSDRLVALNVETEVRCA